MSVNSSTPDNRVQVRERIPEVLPAELMERSDTKGLARLAAHTGLLGCTGMLVFASTSTWWSVPAMLVHGVVLTFLFSPLHECIHRTAFRSRW